MHLVGWFIWMYDDTRTYKPYKSLPVVSAGNLFDQIYIRTVNVKFPLRQRKMKVTHINLSKFISSSKIINGNQMLITFFPHITSVTQNVPFWFIYLLYLKTFSVVQKVQRPTTTWLMNTYWEKIRKQMVMSEAVTFSWHLGGRNSENHKKSQSRLYISAKEYEPWASWIWSQRA
jgi:hypothetical protein